MGWENLYRRCSGFLWAVAGMLRARLLANFGKIDVRGELTAVVLTCGESTYDECRDALYQQTAPITVKSVSGVHPLSASLDVALDCCETKWLLMVDADTILNPRCVEIMTSHLGPGVGMVVAKLYDKVYGVIGFLRLVDAQTLRVHGFRHPPDDPYPDRGARDFLVEKGLKRVVLKAVVGTHNPYATPFEAFRRFYGTFRKRARGEHQIRSHTAFIMKYARREKAWKEAYYMMAGLVCGALADSSLPRDYVKDAEMSRYFEAVANKDRQ